MVANHQSSQHQGRMSLVSRVPPVHTVLRNCARDEGGSFEVGIQVLTSSYRKLLCPKGTVVNVAEKSEQDSDRYEAQANRCRANWLIPREEPDGSAEGGSFCAVTRADQEVHVRNL
jgi:hypothetical protein